MGRSIINISMIHDGSINVSKACRYSEIIIKQLPLNLEY